eukprot:scaffold461_cov321-Pavlova_lutheri.AAC.47
MPDGKGPHRAILHVVHLVDEGVVCLQSPANTNGPAHTPTLSRNTGSSHTVSAVCLSFGPLDASCGPPSATVSSPPGSLCVPSSVSAIFFVVSSRLACVVSACELSRRSRRRFFFLALRSSSSGVRLRDTFTFNGSCLRRRISSRASKRDIAKMAVRAKAMPTRSNLSPPMTSPVEESPPIPNRPRRVTGDSRTLVGGEAHRRDVGMDVGRTWMLERTARRTWMSAGRRTDVAGGSLHSSAVDGTAADGGPRPPSARPWFANV